MKNQLLTKLSQAMRGLADKLAPQPSRVAVESSMIASVGYHNGTLEIEFKSGKVYQYFDVSKSTHARLISADSIGRYFNAHIRDEYEFKPMN